ncbi:hypothetical protein EBT31_22085 [bacterium]|nr:hypothetical protein [bacterium]
MNINDISKIAARNDALEYGREILLAENKKLRDEIERLRARVAELEKPPAARLSKSQEYYQQRTDGNDDLYRRAHEEREP